MSSDDLKNRKNKIVSNMDNTLESIDKGDNEANRGRYVVEPVSVILKDSDGSEWITNLPYVHSID